MASAALGLTAAASVGDNVEALRQHLGASPSPGSVPPPVVITLDATGAQRRELLSQTQALYDCAAQWSIALDFTVLPRVARGHGDVPGLRALTAEDMTAERGYEVHGYVAMGGTFDRLHAGHKMLLTASVFSTRERLRVGISGPLLLKNKKNAEFLQPFALRKAAVEAFVSKLRGDLAYEVLELEEGSGGTNSIAAVEAMVVSPETLPAVEKINAQRREKGFADMVPVLIEYVGGDSDGTRVSSTRLRQLEQQRQQVEMKVTSKKGTGFYVRSAKSFLYDDVDKEGNKKTPISTLSIAGLGGAVNAATAVASACEREGIASIKRIETSYVDMETGPRMCPKIVIALCKL